MNINRLREIREDKDLTQKELASILKISQQQYNKYELGINTIPIEKLNILANNYETSIDYLINRTNEKKPYPKKKKITS
jgi:transcriptional regulator with XRE-family HTH domain